LLSRAVSGYPAGKFRRCYPAETVERPRKGDE
jgi:hypothetical protein